METYSRHEARGPAAGRSRRQGVGRTNSGAGGSRGGGQQPRQQPGQHQGQQQLIRYPWEAPSVGRLAARLGTDKDVQPMMIEGPTGTVFAAVGEERDNRIAGEAIGRAQEAKLQTKLKNARDHVGHVPPPTQPPPSQMGRPGTAEFAFGAVYEHRDCFGKPMAVGETDKIPEERFMLDYRQNSKIQDLMQHRGGRSDVVWAGVGRGSVGHTEMKFVREAIQQDRAHRQNIDKLSGPKPYSRHGY